MKKVFTAPLECKADGPEGAFQATFAWLNQIDKDGDVTCPGAFKSGQKVKIAAWGHNWGALTVGKGTVFADETRAWVEGQFNLATQAGREHYETVKFNGPDQEWSYGFVIEKRSHGEFDGRAVQFLESLDVHECSPVMVGAGNETRTDWIKADKPALKYGGGMGLMGGEPPEGSYEALSEDLEDAFEAQQIPAGSYGYCCVVATYPTHFVACLMLEGSDEMTYWDVPYVMAPDGETPVFGDMTQVEAETVFTPVKGISLPYGLHAARVESAVAGLIERTKAGSAMRGASKEGRPMTEARRTRVAAIRDGLRTHADELHALWEETAPKEPPKSDAEGRRLYARFLQTTARLNGVAV